MLWTFGTLAQAQTTGLTLRSSPVLEEKISERQRTDGAIFVGGEQITARPDMDLVIDGQATVRRPGTSIYDAMGPAVEVSGGSAANTIVGVASLGGRAAFVGKVTMAQCREIAEQKLKGMNARDLDAAAREIAGSARSMGLQVTE